MKYDTSMLDSCRVRLRSLPEGEFSEAQEDGWEGNMVHLTFPDGGAGYAAGALVEIEGESKLYLGQVRQNNESGIRVLVEHTLDRARLAAIQDKWG